MSLYVRTYDASNENGALVEFDVNPAVETIMELLRRVRECITPSNPHTRVGMRLHTYVDHEPGDVINDPQFLGSTLEELHRNGRVQFEEDRRGLHLKVLVDGCRTEKEAAEYIIEQLWRTQYETAALKTNLAESTREVVALKRELAERKPGGAALSTNGKKISNEREASSHWLMSSVVLMFCFAAFLVVFDLTALKNGLTECTKDVVELKTDLAERTKDVAALKTDLAERTKDVVELKTDLAERTKDVAALKTGLAERTKDVVELKTGLAQLTSELVAVKGDVHRLKQHQVTVVRTRTEEREIDVGQKRKKGFGSVVTREKQNRVVEILGSGEERFGQWFGVSWRDHVTAIDLN